MAEDLTWDREADVVVLGSGGAAMTAPAGRWGRA